MEKGRRLGAGKARLNSSSMLVLYSLWGDLFIVLDRVEVLGGKSHSSMVEHVLDLQGVPGSIHGIATKGSRAGGDVKDCTLIRPWRVVSQSQAVLHGSMVGF